MNDNDIKALALAMRKVRPYDYLSNTAARRQWYVVVMTVAEVIQDANPHFHGVRSEWFDLCGVPS